MAGLVVGRPHHQPCCLYPYEARPCQSKGGRPSLTLAGIVVVRTHHYPRLDGRSDTNHQHFYTTCLSGAAQRRDVPNLAAPGPHIRRGQAILMCIGGVDARHLGLEQRNLPPRTKGALQPGSLWRDVPNHRCTWSVAGMRRDVPNLACYYHYPLGAFPSPLPFLTIRFRIKGRRAFIQKRDHISYSG